jgi:hypothetical protein
MRKLFALALLALVLGIVAVSCGKKAEETTPAATENTNTMSDSTMGSGMDTTAMSPDSTKH